MKKTYILFLFSVFSITAFATHQIGGEITYTYLGGLSYKITVATYTNTDPSTTQADRCDLIVYFGDGDSAVAPRVNGASALCTTADGESIGTHIKKNIYEITHNYNYYGNYTISVGDPNREAGICNIPGSVDQPFYIESQLSFDPAITSNSSPKFTATPVFYAAVGVPYLQNVTAYDLEGDILTYELIPCMSTNSSPVMGYTYPTGFNIDNLTGETTWNTPSMICKYNYTVKVKEWRNGTMIGYVIREFQIRTTPSTSVIESLKNEQNILLYPNPVTDKAFISGLYKESGNTLFIYDLTGRLIKRILLSSASYETDLTDLMDGFYNYEILSDKISIARGEFIKN